MGTEVEVTDVPSLEVAFGVVVAAGSDLSPRPFFSSMFLGLSVTGEDLAGISAVTLADTSFSSSDSALRFIAKL